MKINLLFTLILFSVSVPLKALNLTETYELALQNDPLLRQAYLTQFSVGESKSQSIAQMLPTLSVTGKSSFNRLNNKKISFQGVGVQNYWDHVFTINFSQPVFHWDHWIQLSQSNNLIAKAEAEYQLEYQSLIVKTTEAYFNILSAQDTVKFTISEQKSIDRQLDQAKQRFEVGLIAITDVYEAQAAYDQARANLIDAENLLDDSKEALAEIIGEYSADLHELGNSITFSSPIPNKISAWVKTATSNNFAIIAALNQAEVSRKNISIQQAGHLPTVDILANYNTQDANSSFGLRGDTQSVGVQINIPLFQGGMISSKSKQAEFDYKIAKQSLLSTKRKVIRQLKNAFRDVVSSISRIRALQATVTSAASSLEASEAGFEVGTRTMVDVLTEQSNFFRAKRDYSRSRYDYLINGIKLKQAASSLSEQDIQLMNQYLQNPSAH